MTNMDKLYEAVEARGPVCVGLDTDFGYLPAKARNGKGFRLPNTRMIKGPSGHDIQSITFTVNGREIFLGYF